MFFFYAASRRPSRITVCECDYHSLGGTGALGGVVAQLKSKPYCTLVMGSIGGLGEPSKLKKGKSWSFGPNGGPPPPSPEVGPP